MRINICACGPTLNLYRNTGDAAIGVNDVQFHTKWLIHALVVLDPPSAFSEKRRNIISHNYYRYFFSPYTAWERLRFSGNFTKIKLKELIPSNCGDLSNFESVKNLPFSTNSAFVACMLAYHAEAKEIVLYGVDFTPDWVAANNFPLAKTIMHYDNLRHELEQRNVKLYVCSKESALYPTLPIYKSK